ncbi:MAG: hypothetical protein CMB51_03425 [Euryarchaeota archaeon]|nr:hypothetical protein [Euryarchaeota archaeon]
MGRVATTILLSMVFLIQSLSGCFGDDQQTTDYDGPIDLIVYYAVTNGTIQKSVNNGNNGPTTGVEINFDLATTTSSAGAIVTIFLDPDDGTSKIEQDVGESGAEINYEYMTHGMFEAKVGAIDDEENTHEIMVKIRIDERIEYTANNVNNENVMTFNATNDCSDGLPQLDRISITSEVENPGAVFGLGGTSEVSWSLVNPDEVTVSSNTATIGDGQTESWDTTSRDAMPGDWSLIVDVEGDSVTINQVVEMLYLEGSETPPSPRP